jgi:hypothetical protein
MHSFHGKTANFHFDGDMGGDLIIMPKKENGNPLLDKDGELVEVRIDAEDILKLVAYHYVLPEAIGNLENMDHLKLLNILRTNPIDK